MHCQGVMESVWLRVGRGGIFCRVCLAWLLFCLHLSEDVALDYLLQHIELSMIQPKHQTLNILCILTLV